MEIQERNRMISDYVASNYDLHQREIFSSIVTEYTDWQSSNRHPVSIRDGTMEAMEDALYVAPLIETGDYHASLNSKSWFFVFDYQTKHSLYKQVRTHTFTKLGDREVFFFLFPFRASWAASNTHNYFIIQQVLKSR